MVKERMTSPAEQDPKDFSKGLALFRMN